MNEKNEIDVKIEEFNLFKQKMAIVNFIIANMENIITKEEGLLGAGCTFHK